MDAQATSYLMAYQGLLSIIVQVGLIGPLTKRFSDARLITWSLPVQAVGLLAWAFTPQRTGAAGGADPACAHDRCAQHGHQQRHLLGRCRRERRATRWAQSARSKARRA